MPNSILGNKLLIKESNPPGRPSLLLQGQAILFGHETSNKLVSLHATKIWQ